MNSIYDLKSRVKQSMHTRENESSEEEEINLIECDFHHLTTRCDAFMDFFYCNDIKITS